MARKPRAPHLKAARPQGDHPATTRGPRGLQQSLRIAPPLPYAPMPAWFRAKYPAASLPEWVCYWVLTVLLKLQEGLDFEYQATFLGGHNVAGGFVPDFVLYNPPGIGINIQGVYFHLERGAEQKAQDQLQRAILLSYQILLIWIDDVDILRAPRYFVTEAIAGVDHSIEGRGN